MLLQICDTQKTTIKTLKNVTCVHCFVVSGMVHAQEGVGGVSTCHGGGGGGGGTKYMPWGWGWGGTKYMPREEEGGGGGSKNMP